MVIRTIAWMVLLPVLLFGVFSGYEALDAGSSVQSLSVQNDGSIIANQRDGSSSKVITDGTISDQNIKGTLYLGDTGSLNGFIFSDDDIYIRPDANDNGTNFIVFRQADNTTKMLFHGDNGDMEMQARTDGNCGVGNVCSGTGTVVVNSTSNVDSTTNGQFQYTRVGDVVTLGFTIGIDPAAASVGTFFQVNVLIPQRTGNFSASYDATGLCAGDQNTGERQNVAIVRADIANPTQINIVKTDPLDTSLRNWVCHVTYRANL